MCLRQGMNIARFEDRLTTVMMTLWPRVVRGSQETQSTDTLCDLVSGTSRGVGWLAVLTCRDLGNWHTSQLNM